VVPSRTPMDIESFGLDQPVELTPETVIEPTPMPESELAPTSMDTPETMDMPMMDMEMDMPMGLGVVD